MVCPLTNRRSTRFRFRTFCFHFMFYLLMSFGKAMSTFTAMWMTHSWTFWWNMMNPQNCPPWKPVFQTRKWMVTNVLLLNSDKTGIIFLGPKKQRDLLLNLTINIYGWTVISNKTVKDLSVTLEPDLSLDEHIKNFSRTHFFVTIKNLFIFLICSFSWFENGFKWWAYVTGLHTINNITFLLILTN